MNQHSDVKLRNYTPDDYIIKDNRSSKTGFTIEVIVVNITFRETLSQKILDLKILQVFIETLLIFRRN